MTPCLYLDVKRDQTTQWLSETGRVSVTQRQGVAPSSRYLTRALTKGKTTLWHTIIYLLMVSVCVCVCLRDKEGDGKISPGGAVSRSYLQIKRSREFIWNWPTCQQEEQHSHCLIKTANFPWWTLKQMWMEALKVTPNRTSGSEAACSGHQLNMFDHALRHSLHLYASPAFCRTVYKNRNKQSALYTLTGGGGGDNMYKLQRMKGSPDCIPDLPCVSSGRWFTPMSTAIGSRPPRDKKQTCDSCHPGI